MEEEDAFECPECDNTILRYMNILGNRIVCELCGEDYPIPHGFGYPDRDEMREAAYTKEYQDGYII